MRKNNCLSNNLKFISRKDAKFFLASCFHFAPLRETYNISIPEFFAAKTENELTFSTKLSQSRISFDK